MKKITIFVFLLMFGAIITPFSVKPTLVRAEDGKQNFQRAHNDDSSDSNYNDNEDQNNDEQDNEEHDIYFALKEDRSSAPEIDLSEVDEKTIITYADAIAILREYETALDEIDAAAGVDTESTTLTLAERRLLNGLVSKHKKHMNHLESRINETKVQLKSLEELLLPVGTQPISVSTGIKGLLIAELNNYHDIIMGISEFDGLTNDILEQETD